ncbi:MAG: ABC transporter substrate-binding protein [Eubacterium sp.]|nr:ABC transporter substrate-binding protein [Eubacterium sp.]
MRADKRKKRVLSVLLGGVMLASMMLTGCAAQDKTNTVVVQNQDTVHISMSWWGNDDRHKYTLSGLALFHDDHPEITVSHRYGIWDGYEQRNKIYMESHECADVMQINYNWLSVYSPDGKGYYDLNALSDVIDLSNFSEDDLAFGMRDGKLNALPIAYNSTAFFYNKTIYDRYGLSVPESWDDLFAAAKLMSADNIYPLGLSKKQLILSLAAWYEQTYGEPLFSDTGALQADLDQMKAMLSFYKSLISEKVIPAVDDFDATSFTAGKTAGAGCWSSEASRYCDDLDESGAEVVLGQTPGLKGADTTGWKIKPATMYAISAYTEHPVEAGELLDFLLNDPRMAKLQGTEKGVPVSKAALKTLENNHMLDDFDARAGEQLNQNKEKLGVMVPALEDADVISTFKNETDKYIYDQEDLDTCASQLVEELGSQ